MDDNILTLSDYSKIPPVFQFRPDQSKPPLGTLRVNAADLWEFEGDAKESAKVFFDYLINLQEEWWKQRRAEIKRKAKLELLEEVIEEVHREDEGLGAYLCNEYLDKKKQTILTDR